MTKKEEKLSDLKKHNIKKSQDNFRKVMTLSLFNADIDPNFLYNTGTGKVASESTATFLLTTVTTGETERKKFINKCIRGPARFEKPIKLDKLATFTTESGKPKKQRW